MGLTKLLIMKTPQNINYILASLAILITLFTSCEEESNIAPLESFTLSETTIVAPAENFSLALDRNNRQELFRFEWEAAETTGSSAVTYTVFIDLDSGDFTTPILEQETTSQGEDTFLEIPFFTLDELLSEAGFAPNETAALQWRVEARSINQLSISDTNIVLQRFDIPGPPTALFLAGDATEAGTSVSNALEMLRLTNADGSATNSFELYTALEFGRNYNFYTSQSLADADVYTATGETITLGDTPIIAPETGEYRITINFDAQSITLFRIDRWSIVGNVIPGSWGGDQPLEYQGNGIWESTIELIDAEPTDANKRFVFRANEDWGQVIKGVPATNDVVAFEPTSADFGFDTLNDILVPELGFQVITLRLNGEGYTFSIAPGVAPEPDPNATIQETPENLFLSGAATEGGSVLSNALAMYRITNADGTPSEVFEIYTMLTQGETYNFYNSNSGTPIAYTLNNGVLELGDNGIVAMDETAVYRLTVNFATNTLETQRINHWSIVGNVIENAWGGDEPLQYQGNGVWRSTITLIDADTADANKRFVFRANEDWAFVFKEIPETNMQVAFEDTAQDFGFDTLNDIAVPNLGETTITLTLNGNGYSYTLE